MTGMAEAMAKRGIEVLVLADGKTHEADHKQKYKIKRFTGWKPLRRLAKAKYVEKICNSKNVKAIYADSWKSIEYLKKYRKKIGKKIDKVKLTRSIDGSNDYYNIWLRALIELISNKGITDAEAISDVQNCWADAYRNTPHGKPVKL